jgi:hypothetical protein
MYIFFAAVFIAIVLVICVIYAAKKRGLLTRMTRLVDGAKVIAYARLLSDLRSGQTTGDLHFDQTLADSDDKLCRVAAASVNYWFNAAPTEKHSDLDLEHIHADSIRWLSRNDDMREMVVQSLRVFFTIRYAKAGSLDNTVSNDALLHWLNAKKITGFEFDTADTESLADSHPRRAAGGYVLAVFGEQYPEALFPHAFDALIRREMQKVPPGDQATIRQIIGG